MAGLCSITSKCKYISLLHIIISNKFNILCMCLIAGPTAGDATAHAPGHGLVTAADPGLGREALELWDQLAKKDEGTLDCQHRPSEQLCRWFVEGEIWTINKSFSGRNPQFCFVCL